LDVFLQGKDFGCGPAYAVIVVVLVVVWRRERQLSLAWAAAAYLLPIVGALPGGDLFFPIEFLSSRALLAWAVSRYLGLGRAPGAALAVLPLAVLWSPAWMALATLAGVDLVVALLFARAVASEPRAGHALLATASLTSASLSALAAGLAGLDGLAPARDLLGLGGLAFGVALPVAAMMRGHQAARSEGAFMQRMTHFYDALSRTNRAIARVKDPTALFDAICQICVDAGHARMACVYVLDGALATRAATAGPAAEILSGIPQPWDTSEPQARASYTVQALQEGQPLASNDYQNDPRAAAWRDQAVRHGVRAFAWLPFRRRNSVDGVLMLAAGSAGFFDDALMKLLEKLVGDISLALDAIDQDRERERAQREAQASLERFQRLFHAAPVPSIILSISDRRVLAVNDAACVSTGMTREAMLGRQSLELASRLSEDDRESFYEEMRRNGRVRNRIFHVHRPDGSQHDELFNAEPVDYLEQACVMIMTLDITDLRETERVRQALDRSEAASRAKTEFLSRMSHELRTPLNAVLGFAQLLSRDAKDRLTERELTQLELVQQAGWHLLTLINDVLDVSRIEAGQLAVQAGPLALRPLLDEALDMNRAIAERQAVTLHADYTQAPELGVHADPTRLRQVVFNVVSNALKYTQAGGSVRIALKADAAEVHLLVEDTGLGMTREQLAHLYEPFNRLGRERGAVEGTGMGLVLTRELLRLMRGGIVVESEIGVGTRVRLSLPRAEVPAAIQAPAGAQAALPEPIVTASPAGVVLYIEDNDVNALLVEQLLARWADVQFVRAHDGRTGIALATKLRPDLVLLDMQLPDIDGIEVLQRLKKDRTTRELRVIVLSANAMPEDLRRAKALGADEYWTKPLAFDRFLADVSRLLVRQQGLVAQGR
jgi:PAS domain S-box-containing protein